MKSYSIEKAKASSDKAVENLLNTLSEDIQQLTILAHERGLIVEAETSELNERTGGSVIRQHLVMPRDRHVPKTVYKLWKLISGVSSDDAGTIKP